MRGVLIVVAIVVVIAIAIGIITCQGGKLAFEGSNVSSVSIKLFVCL